MTTQNIVRTKKVAALAIVAGIILYLSKFLRIHFTDHSAVIFVLGFLPNFGLAFAIPFIYVTNRVRIGKPIKHFGVACVITLLLMTLNEIRDKYQTGRVFDVNDIYASVAGVALAYAVYMKTLRRNAPATV